MASKTALQESGFSSPVGGVGSSVVVVHGGVSGNNVVVGNVVTVLPAENGKTFRLV